MSPSRQRRLAEQKAHAASLGLSFDEWLACRHADAKRRAHDHVARLDRITEDRRYRLAHPDAMYPRSALGYVLHHADVCHETYFEAMRRQLWEGA